MRPARLERRLPLGNGLLALGERVLQRLVRAVQRLVPQVLEGLGHAFRELWEFVPGHIPQARAEFRPPGIQMIVDGVGGAPPEPHPDSIDRRAVPFHQQLVVGAKHIGLRDSRGAAGEWSHGAVGIDLIAGVEIVFRSRLKINVTHFAF